MRFLFTLVNLTAKFDEARQQLFQCEGCTDTLLQLYDSYQRRDEGEPPAPAARVEENENVLVKLVSVLANMCVHPAVGPILAANRTCTELLLETLGEQRTHLKMFYPKMTDLQLQHSAGNLERLQVLK